MHKVVEERDLKEGVPCGTYGTKMKGQVASARLGGRVLEQAQERRFERETSK